MGLVFTGSRFGAEDKLEVIGCPNELALTQTGLCSLFVRIESEKPHDAGTLERKPARCETGETGQKIEIAHGL